jgi:hypothetical protein
MKYGIKALPLNFTTVPNSSSSEVFWLVILSLYKIISAAEVRLCSAD